MTAGSQIAGSMSARRLVRGDQAQEQPIQEAGGVLVQRSQPGRIQRTAPT